MQTLGYHIDAFTGQVAGATDGNAGDLGKMIFEGKRNTVFLTPFTNCGSKNRVLGVVDTNENVHIFPFCKKVAKDLLDISHKFFFTTTARDISGSILSGHVLTGQTNSTLNTASTWSLAITDDEHLENITPASYGPIASYGRAIGDKSTLYKYLNPHLTVLTTSDVKHDQAKVIVLDTVSGHRIYEVVLRDIVLDKGVQVAMSDNWLVYSWLDKQGWRIASVELYEDRREFKADT